MKKLKFLLIPLISLLFVINVNATEQYTNGVVSNLDRYLSTGKSLSDFQQLIKNNVDFDSLITKENYIVEVQNYNSNVRSFYIAIYQSDDLFNFASGNGGLFLSNNIDQGDFYMIFDSNYETFTTNIQDFHYTTNMSSIPFGDSFNRLFIFSNLTEIQYTSPTWYEVPIAINNNEYNFNDYIPLNDFNSNYSSINIIPAIYVEPPIEYCDPNDYLGQMSNVSDFTITIKGTTNVLSEKITGSFDIISNKTMSESDWVISSEHTPDDIISTGSLSCIANRCVFHFLASVEDDIDEEVTLKYKFISSSMPTKIQIDTCNNNNLHLNFSYTYTNNNTNTNTNTDNTIITDDSNMNNFMQDGSLPDYSDLGNANIIPNGPVDAILTLPLNIMNNLLNVLNSSSCQPLVLPIPFTGGQNLTLPCISTLYQKIDGLPTFLNWFSAIFSAFILYQYFINLYRWVDDTLTFRENNHFGGY